VREIVAKEIIAREVVAKEIIAREVVATAFEQKICSLIIYQTEL
jgi:hypothetical protein